MRGTTKACHGCGTAGAPRPVDEVCGRCRELLRAGAAAGQEKESPGRLYRLTAEWPSFYSAGSSTVRLGKAIALVARAAMKPHRTPPYADQVCELPPAGGQVNYFSTYDERATTWRGSRKFAEALQALDFEIREALSRAYAAGKQDGSNLLLSIASGEVTVNDLTRASLEGGSA